MTEAGGDEEEVETETIHETTIGIMIGTIGTTTTAAHGATAEVK